MRKICLLTYILLLAGLQNIDSQATAQAQRWDVFADLLFWCPQETCTQWGFLVNPDWAVPPPPASSKNNVNTFLTALDFDWNWGVRTGLGYTLDHDAWNTRLFYTWFHSQGKSQLMASADYVVQSQFIASDFIYRAPLFQEAAIRWALLFNMFDWDLGRNCPLSRFLCFRHYLGLKGGWIHQNVHIHWIDPTYQALEKIKHNFWAVGPKGGVDSKWILGNIQKHCFSLFGDFASAFMWGHWDLCNDSLHDTRDITTHNFFPARDLGSLMFQTIAGFEWNFEQKDLYFSLHLGYEMQIWLEHLQFFQHFSGLLHNALILQGGTFRFNFAF